MIDMTKYTPPIYDEHYAATQVDPRCLIMTINEIETAIAENKMNAAQVFTQMLQHVPTDEEIMRMVEMETVARKFIDRVERGEVRSRKTYSDFKAVIGDKPQLFTAGLSK